MLRNKAELVDGWTLYFDEISNNVYKVILTDSYGRQAGTTDHDLHRAIEICLSYAFDIEKQLSNSLNKFTYDIFKYFLSDQKLSADYYSDKDFGSWLIQKLGKRIILEGKDLLLIFQNQSKTGDWTDDATINLKDLTFERLKEMANDIQS